MSEKDNIKQFTTQNQEQLVGFGTPDMMRTPIYGAVPVNPNMTYEQSIGDTPEMSGYKHKNLELKEGDVIIRINGNINHKYLILKAIRCEDFARQIHYTAIDLHNLSFVETTCAEEFLVPLYHLDDKVFEDFVDTYINVYNKSMDIVKRINF